MPKPTRGMLIVLIGSHLQEAHRGPRAVDLGVYDRVDVYRCRRARLVGWNGRITQAARTHLQREGYLDA